MAAGGCVLALSAACKATAAQKSATAKRRQVFLNMGMGSGREGKGFKLLQAFYGIKPADPREPRAFGNQVIALIARVAFAFDSSGQIQSDKSKPGLAILGIFKTHDVLMPFRTRLELQAVLARAVVVAVDLYAAMVSIVGAVQPLGRRNGSANRGIALADDDVAVAAQCL